VEFRLLSDVPPEEARELLAVSRRRTFAKGEVVFHAGDPGDSLHLVVKGSFAVRLIAPRGDTVTVAVRGPGDNFGEMALAAPDARRSATVAALEPAETLAVYYGEFERLSRRHPEMSQVLISFLSAEIRRQNELLLDALYVPAERRVVRRLAELADVYADGDGVIALTQEELAQIAGTSRGTVNRVLREQEERGAISLRRGKTTIVDRDALRGADPRGLPRR
jgi:CRP/FNR family transcriptional regulator, cyclic AMP receptor protein